MESNSAYVIIVVVLIQQCTLLAILVSGHSLVHVGDVVSSSMLSTGVTALVPGMCMCRYMLCACVATCCVHVSLHVVCMCTGITSPSGDDIEYAAIKTIHKQLDDNADGSLDFSESAEVCEVVPGMCMCR